MSKLVVGNLKMNIISVIERKNYFKSFNDISKKLKASNVKVVLCPPAIHLESFVNKIKNGQIDFGAQNVYFKNKGAYTGEISPVMVKNFGGNYVIIGHSERRRYFKEKNGDINKKIVMSLKSKLSPILCIGETRKEREEGKLKKIISNQLKEGLNKISKKNISNTVIAYEPIWAIGAGKSPTADNIMEVQILIKKILVDTFSIKINKMPKILYGGSVNYRNIEEVCLSAGMDGVLVGGESLHPVDFLKIVENINKNN